MKFLPKNKTGGVVTSTVMGVGGLIIATILILVITQTMLTSDLISDDTGLTTVRNNQNTTTMNESGLVTFGNNTIGNSRSCVVNSASLINATDEIVLVIGNYTVTSSSCTIITNEGAGVYNSTIWSINSTTTYSQDGNEEISATAMSTNFTAGLDNISSKIPTILLIIAVVFLFGVLVLLIKQSRAMGVGGGGSGSL